MNVHSYDLGQHVLNGIDISIPQQNYMNKYGSDALDAQKRFFSELGILKSFEKRVAMACSFEMKIKRVVDFSHSGYDTEMRSKASGYDAIYTSLVGLPLVTFWGDCPQLMVSGKKTIGIVHAARETLDKRVIEEFFNVFLKEESPKNVHVGFSPYIQPKNFSHGKILLERAQEWLETGCIERQNEQYYLNLKNMIERDLSQVGIPDKNIHNAKLSTYDISFASLKAKGYKVSHRHAAKTHQGKEGRGIVCIMLKETCLTSGQQKKQQLFAPALSEVA